MASRWFIINEWLFYNLSGYKDSDQDDPETINRRKEESVQFLEALFVRRDDGLVVLRNGPWIRALRRWADRADKASVKDRNMSKQFFRRVLLQPDRRKFIEEDEIVELPPELRRLIRTHKDDEIEEYINDEDEYLLLTWLSSPVKIEYIVTTDSGLHIALAKHYPVIKTRHRDCFLKEYLGKSPAR